MNIKEQPPEEKEAKDVPNPLVENKESLITSEMDGNENSEKTQAATIWVDNSETELTEDEQTEMIDEMRQSELIEAIVEKAIKKSMEHIKETVKEAVDESVRNHTQEDTNIKSEALWNYFWGPIKKYWFRIFLWSCVLSTIYIWINNWFSADWPCILWTFVLVYFLALISIAGTSTISRLVVVNMWNRAQDIFRGAVLSTLFSIVITSLPETIEKGLTFSGALASIPSTNDSNNRVFLVFISIVFVVLFIGIEQWLDKRNKEKNKDKMNKE